MVDISFADVVHQSIRFSPDQKCEALVLSLIESVWMQRLRDISQTANTRLVFMFSEHSRFGHSLGVAYLACRLMERLSRDFNSQIKDYREAICAAALLHDVGHIAPGSHTAQKAWFAGQPDAHEELSAIITETDEEIRSKLADFGHETAELCVRILRDDPALPPWTRELISGGGWNIDRGNWCIVDSIMAGVSYGKYNIPALTDSIVLMADGHLAIRENRLDAMMHFAVSRHAMYSQIYQHRVLLSADALAISIVKRARVLGADISFADEPMRLALAAKRATDLRLETVFAMREAWWRYHLYRWSSGPDPILADLSKRMLYRRLFKTVRISKDDDPDALKQDAIKALEACGYDPEYYLYQVSTEDVHSNDSKQSLVVLLDNGQILPLSESEPVFRTMIFESNEVHHSWLVMPQEAKERLGRSR
ncbi:MAG: HD domain-containing protein [Deltaproteobacteria bacterium]|nr:HD domain-containing protein [Deltaproteobacteria bacterium]